MSDEINNGGPAFPTNEGDTYDGMTLRDWFAGQAMVGLMSGGGYPRSIVPELAYKLADDMIAERRKGKS